MKRLIVCLVLAGFLVTVIATSGVADPSFIISQVVVPVEIVSVQVEVTQTPFGLATALLVTVRAPDGTTAVLRVDAFPK